MSGSIKMKSRTSLLALVSLGFLAGCTGTSTYGTGKSQEGQLYEDLLGIASLGQKDKPRIDYMSRPKLVKPPTVASLPTPAEKVGSQSGYFPKDPETERAARLAAIADAEANGTALPDSVVAERRAAALRGQTGKSIVDERQRGTVLGPELLRRQREVFLKQKAERAGTRGAASRKYLTEPPKTYRTPEQTAAVGQVGEKEKNPYKRKTGGNILDSLFGK